MDEKTRDRIATMANRLLDLLLAEDDARVLTATLAAVIVTMCQISQTPVDDFLRLVMDLDEAAFPPKSYTN